MNPVSNEIFDFLEERIKNKHFHDNTEKLSRFSASLLSKIFNHLISAEKEYISPELTWLSMKTHSLPKGYDFEYCNAIIKTEIEKMKKTACIYSFKIKNHIFQVAIVSPLSKRICEKKFNAYIKRIYLWLYIATINSPPICSQKLNIYLYLTNLSKSIPGGREELSQIHANTAFTTSCKKNTEIHIYREEEWFKVLIHESFHCFGLDFSAENQETINREIYALFPINSKMNIFEVYCEMFAEIINDMFISWHFTKKSENLEKYVGDLIRKTETFLNNERMFSLFQCAKVLNHYGIKYIDLFERTPESIQNRKKYRENNTNIFSYYILKAIFLFFYDDFLEWCFIHNNQNVAFNVKKMKDFSIFIRDHYKKKEFLEAIHNMEKFFYEHRHAENTYTMNTMRMSLYELL
jgi:hypothetical protein